MNDFEQDEYIRKLIEAQLQQEAQKQSLFDRVKNTSAKVGKYGNDISTLGKYISKINNAKAQAIGSKFTNFGNNLSYGANNVNNVLNAPQNYVKDAQNQIVGTGLQKAGGYLSQKPGIVGDLGTKMFNYGSNLAGTTAAGTTAAGTTAGATSGATAGTAAGTGAATIGSTAGTAAATGGTAAASGAAGGAAAGGATGGAAAGGAAAGGSAAGGAAAAGPIGALIALGAMALQGTNRKRAKNAGNALLSETMEMVNEEPQKFENPTTVNPIFENALNNSYEGITGGAAPLQGGVTQNVTPQQQTLLPSGGNTISEAINNEVNATPQNIESLQIPTENQTAAQTQAAPQQQSFISKLASGFGDFSRGFNENLNNSFNPNNLTADQFTETINPNNTKLADYQAQLLNNGIDANVVNAVAQGKNSGNKDIDAWIKSNPDAFAQTKTYDKGKMARLGEAVGSIARFSQKPAVQALIAGGLSTALTGNPMYGLGQAYKFGSQRAKNSIYEQALQKYGISPNTGFFGTVGPQDLNAIGNLYYKDLLDVYRNKQLAEQSNYHQGTLEQRARANDIREKQGNEKNRIAAIKAAKTGNGRGSGNSKAAKAEYTKNLNKDLAGYSTLTPEQKKKIRPKMIETYGKDFLSQESKFSPKEEKKYTAPGL